MDHIKAYTKYELLHACPFDCVVVVVNRLQYQTFDANVQCIFYLLIIVLQSKFFVSSTILISHRS